MYDNNTHSERKKMMYTYFPHAFLFTIYCSLTFMFVHNTFKSVRTKVFTPQITEYKVYSHHK
jgi:hypothetical protein